MKPKPKMCPMRAWVPVDGFGNVWWMWACTDRQRAWDHIHIMFAAVRNEAGFRRGWRIVRCRVED